MTVTDYVMLGRSAHRGFLGRESPRDRRVVAAVLEQLHLTALARRRMGHLSGGQAQRAVLARSLAQEAPLLALDEPTSSLDLGHSQLVLETIDQLRKDHGLTVLSAVHDLTLAAKYADRLLMLTPNRSVLDGRPEEILDAETVHATFCATVEVLPRPDGPVVAPVRTPHSMRGSHDSDPTY
jgi:iron complex transport system ATP-binding protein